jgi:uncharacterized protein (DUF2267 family)
MATLNEEQLIGDVMARAPFRDRASALEAVGAALEKVGACLPRADAEAVAEALPAGLAASVRRAHHHRSEPLEALFRHVGQREEVPFGLAIEHAEAILATLAEHLPFEVRSRLHRHLPRAWARFLEPRLFEPPASHPGHGHGTTLAEGRPGSRQPLSEAEPPRAQSQSVVVAGNPHQASKLSSAQGPDTGEPLATGRPGSRTPLSEGGDGRRRE